MARAHARMMKKGLFAKNALNDACAIHTAQQAHQCLPETATSSPCLLCLPKYRGDSLHHELCCHLLRACVGSPPLMRAPQSSTSLVLGRQLSFPHNVEVFLERPVVEPGIQDVLCALHRHRAANQSASLPQTHK